MNSSDLQKFTRDYIKLLEGPLRGLNLTRITEFDEFYTKQVIDSLLPLEQSDVFLQSLNRTHSLIDVGFGGGFPLLPLAFCLPNLSFTGLEARKKKVEAVRFISQELTLENVNVYHERLENILFDKPVTIVFKAVGKVEKYLEMIQVSENVDVFFYKGPNFYEIESVEKSLETWELIEEKSMQLPTNEGRLLIGFRSIKNPNVPHGTKKKLTKLSQLTHRT